MNTIPLRISARVVLLNEKNELFLLKYHVSDEIFWLTPGGQVEGHETILAAAQRELFEETGLLVSDVDFVQYPCWYCEGIYTVKGQETFFKEYFFLARIKNKTVHTANFKENEKHEIVDCRWWDLNEFIKSGEMFYPPALLNALRTAVYDNHVPQEMVIIKR